MSFPLRKAAMVLLILAMTVGLTAASTIAFGRRFEEPGAAAAPVSAAALARLSGTDLSRTIAQLQLRLREQPKDAESWSTLGLAYIEQARVTADPSYYRKAEGVLARSLQVRPRDNEPALTAQAALAAARHDFSTALRLADQALAVNAYAIRANSVRVDALVELGRYDEAWAAVRKADELRPGIQIFVRYAYVQELRGRPDQAGDVLERALEISTDRTDVTYVATQLGELAWHRGDLKAAGKYYDEALQADPSSLAALDGRARVRAARDDYKGALADRTKLVARAPLPAYVVTLGELYEANGEPDNARQQYSVAGAWAALARSNGVRTDLEASFIASDHGNKGDALRGAQAELARRKSIHVEDALAWALHVNGRDEEALEHAEEAARTGYRDATFLYHRGMIEKALGRESAARRSLSAALKLNPHFSDLHADRAGEALEDLS